MVKLTQERTSTREKNANYQVGIPFQRHNSKRTCFGWRQRRGVDRSGAWISVEAYLKSISIPPSLTPSPFYSLDSIPSSPPYQSFRPQTHTRLCPHNLEQACPFPEDRSLGQDYHPSASEHQRPGRFYCFTLRETLRCGIQKKPRLLNKTRWCL